MHAIGYTYTPINSAAFLSHACERILFLVQFRHLFESLGKNDRKEINAYRGIIERQAVKGQGVSYSRIHNP